MKVVRIRLIVCIKPRFGLHGPGVRTKHKEHRSVANRLCQATLRPTAQAWTTSQATLRSTAPQVRTTGRDTGHSHRPPRALPMPLQAWTTRQASASEEALF